MSFDSLAPHYRWMELVLAGDKLQRCRTAFLKQSARATRVLIVGEGNGRFLVACRKHFSAAQITCLDSSSRMLEMARRCVATSGLDPNRIEFIQSDILEWKAPQRCFDLIVTNFFLDCFPPGQLERVVAVLARAALPGATWWLADFQVPASCLIRLRALLIHRVMYGFFRMVTRLPATELTPPDRFLEQHGFVLRRRLVTEWGLLHADEWRLAAASIE
jgi:ubiquinone/menaquinone biosynthesis C-methylase UbiE